MTRTFLLKVFVTILFFSLILCPRVHAQGVSVSVEVIQQQVNNLPSTKYQRPLDLLWASFAVMLVNTANQELIAVAETKWSDEDVWQRIPGPGIGIPAGEENPNGELTPIELIAFAANRNVGANLPRTLVFQYRIKFYILDDYDLENDVPTGDPWDQDTIDAVTWNFNDEK